MERFGELFSSPSLASPSSTPSRSPSPSPSCIKGRASILCKNTFTHPTRYYLTLLLLSTSVKLYIPKTTTYLQLFTFRLPLGHVYSLLFTFFTYSPIRYFRPCDLLLLNISTLVLHLTIPRQYIGICSPLLITHYFKTM